MTRPLCLLLLISTTVIAGCATTATSAPVPQVKSEVQALAAAPPATDTPVALGPPQQLIVEVPVPLPLPGQLKPLPAAARTPEPASPATRILQANAASRMEPVRDGFINAMQVWPFVDGALYQLYTAPGHVTDIALEPGEKLVGPGPVAAGDTVRWIIGDTESGTGAAKQVHILVKPTRSDIGTNLVINTDRRTYHLELRATERTWMASVRWDYPQRALLAPPQGKAEPERQAAAGVDPASLDFGYVLSGDRPAWRPVRAFNDGSQVYIEFDRSIAQGEMPPLFQVGADGKSLELINYRVRGNYMIVDQLFSIAELRMGSGKRQASVRIQRDVGHRP
ncbi:P-type conjugative transfer protein TrbG [Sandaracinobacteroides hominis]|uniref:P-type conjugative transfer protein TrbG n=1 Tax=Sandaracinobacteroides hominis TaxID=2780086 RepID=UPI0018F3CF63|nr:P-type conjugative transfer protein TrbG [Sandaracinobacteroides hominis]